MIKKKLTRALALGLCAAVLVPSAISAKEFKDVSRHGKYYWAYDAIDELSNKNIIAGYETGEFKPDDPVSFEEVFRLIQGVVNPSRDELNKAVDKYGKFCDDYGVSSWAKEAVSFGLYRDIISEKTVKDASSKGFLSRDNRVYPTRSNIAVFYARGLDLSANGNEALLRHEDRDKISGSVKGYLASLIQAGIFTATGSDGKFEGDRHIRRCEMAIITKLSYDYVAKHPVAPQVETMKGKVILASQLDNSNILIIEKDNKKYSFDLTSSTEYKNNGKVAAFKDLQQGQEVEVQYVKSKNDDRTGTAKIVDIKSTEQDLVGYVNTKSYNNLTIRYRENNKDVNLKTKSKISTADTKTFEFDDKAKIFRYGKEIKWNDIEIDDLIEYKTDLNGKIKDAFVFPKTGKVRGKIVSYDDSSINGYVTLKLDDGKEYTFYIIDRDVKGVRDLRRDDYVTLNLTYKVIESINQNEQEIDDMTGQVIDFKSPNNVWNSSNMGSIRIRPERGTDRTFTVDRYTTFIDKSGKRHYMENITDRTLLNKYVRIVLDRYDVVETITEVDHSEKNFAATVQVVQRNSYNYVFKILQSNNTNVRPGGEIEFVERVNLNFREYDILSIEGNASGKSLSVNEPKKLGNPGIWIRPDDRVRNERDFRSYNDLIRNYGYGNPNGDYNMTVR